MVEGVGVEGLEMVDGEDWLSKEGKGRGHRAARVE